MWKVWKFWSMPITWRLTRCPVRARMVGHPRLYAWSSYRAHAEGKDDPLLSARVDGVHRQPRRIVFDSEARLPLDSKLVRGVVEVPVTVVCSRAAARTSVQALESAGVDVIVATGQNEAARVKHALGELGAREVQSLLLEGGPHLAGAFLEADEVDEARIFVAPLLTGGREAKTPVEGIGIERIAAAPRALHVDVDRLDDDVLIVARLKDW